MKKMSIKLAVITVTLILSLSVVVMSSYAWFVMSTSPTVSGIQVTIGGGNTILIAPDVTQVVDGVTYHYPGRFSDSMNFSQFDSYDYLQELGGLTPVSTADGTNWFLPEYYDFSDREVKDGKVLSGALKDISEFSNDRHLEHANLPASQKESIEKGSYYYLDFWVVSPGTGYTLRLSTGEDGGSFVIDLLQPTAGADGTYTLARSENLAGAAVRIGLMANEARLMDDSMRYYQNSLSYDERYTTLQGIYSEPGTYSSSSENNRFIIYEPNGDWHPYGSAPEGTYLHTQPVGVSGGTVDTVSVEDRLTVQMTNRFALAQAGTDSTDTAIEQMFQTAITGKDLSQMSTEEIRSVFYDTYLQGQISPYINKGSFITRTADLYQYGGIVTAEQLSALDASGATEDVYIIQLERNVPQRIRMFIWLEGQDADCVNEVAAGSFAVNLEFAGSNQDFE